MTNSNTFFRTHGYKLRMERWLEDLSQGNTDGEDPVGDKVANEPLPWRRKKAQETIIEQVLSVQYTASLK